MNMHTPARMTEANAKRIAEGLIPELRTRALLADEMRKVPLENIDLLKKSGLLQVIQPALRGGHELTMRAHVDVVSTIARGCNATAWVLGVYQAHSWLLAHMNEQAQRDIYGDGGAQAVAGVIGPRGNATRKADGSYLLSGFWPFASGNVAASWLLLGSKIFDEAGNKLDEGDLLVPKSELEVLDDWFVSGLQGTGSSSVKCTNLRVPGHRYLSLTLLENQTTPYSDPSEPETFQFW